MGVHYLANIVVFNYGLLSVRDRRKNTEEYIEQATRKYGDYRGLRSQMKVKAREHSELRKELAGLPVFAAGRRKELKAKIERLSEEIAELQFEVKSIMRVFDKIGAPERRRLRRKSPDPKPASLNWTRRR